MTRIIKGYIKLILLTSKSQHSGYTLLESVMALVVVGILITSVAPMLALTTASRVQARRVDLATQALRAYTDGVRGGALPIPQRFVVPDTNTVLGGKPKIDFNGPSFGFPPETSLIGYINDPNRNPGTLVDTNGNGFSVDDPQDLVIQAIRPVASGCIPPACIANSPIELDLARKQGFIMIVRVFRADAFANGGVPLKTNNDPESNTLQSNIFIGTLGNRNRPLVSTFAEVFVQGATSNDIIARNQRDFDVFGNGSLTLGGGP